MNKIDITRPGSVIIDALVLGATVIGANWLLARTDPGWIELNPSPYLIIPVLLGARYGFTSGLLAGIGTSLLVAAQQAFAGSLSFRSALGETIYLHASLVFAGGIAGELYAWLHRERAQSDVQLEKLQASVRQLDGEVSYLRTMKDEYDRAVAASGGEISSLDAELRRLHTNSLEELPAAMLQLLKRQVRVTDAAVYALDADHDTLRRQALLGHETHLPEIFDRSSSAIVRLALEKRSLVTLPELLQRSAPPAGENVLLAAPLNDADGQPHALLVVTGIPFISFTPKAADLIALICDWAGELIELSSGDKGHYRVSAGSDPQRIFTFEHFQHLVRLSYSAYNRHHLSSSIIVLTWPGAPASDQLRFEQTLLGAIRTGDFAAEMNTTCPQLVVLLPLVGERGADIFLKRCRQALTALDAPPAELKVTRHTFAQYDRVDELIAAVIAS